MVKAVWALKELLLWRELLQRESELCSWRGWISEEQQLTCWAEESAQMTGTKAPAVVFVVVGKLAVAVASAVVY